MELTLAPTAMADFQGMPRGSPGAETVQLVDLKVVELANFVSVLK